MRKNVVASIVLLLAFELSIIAQSTKTLKMEYSKDSIPILITFNTDSIKKKHSDGISVIKEYLKLSTDDSFKSKKYFTDNLGFLHERFQHYYKGLKVEFSEYNVHSIKDQITSISGTVKRIKSFNIKPSLNEKEALSFALNNIRAERYMWENSEMEESLKKMKNDSLATYYPKGDLVIWTDWNSNTYALSYKFDVYSSKPLSREFVYIDAQDGHIVDIQDIMKNDYPEIANVPTRYCDDQYVTVTHVGYLGAKLVDTERNIETKNLEQTTLISNAVDFVNVSEYGIWSPLIWDNWLKDNAALDAHFAAEKTYDYFNQPFIGRQGWDGNNSLLTLYVHYGLDWDNAQWDPVNNCIELGDGDAGVNYDPFTDLDAVAHEYAHGIKDSEIGQGYTGEPGAIEEGLSDIWAACVETYASLPNHNPWIMLDGFEKTGVHRRNMANPNLNPYHYHLNPYQGDPYNYPDVYLLGYWYTGPLNTYFTHVNSTVLSHWFYLLSQGGSGTNSQQVCYNVSPIGMTDAAKIVYYMETVYLTTSSTFPVARTYSIQSATLLFGENSNQVAQVMNAWHAVGVGEGYNYPITGSYPVCSSPTTYNINYLPSGATVSWNKSYNINFVSSTTSSYTCTGTAGETGWIEANISGICTPATLRVNVWVGPPSLSYISGPEYGQIYNTYYFSAYPSWEPSSGANYSWYLNPLNDNNVRPSYSNADISFYSSGDYQVAAQATNSCGSSGWATANIHIEGGGYYSISPNPATNEVTVTVKQNVLAKAGEIPENNLIYTVSIYNMYGILQNQDKYSGDRFTISVSNLKNGNYFIRISNGKTTSNHQLIIKH